jgi:hypothetical protein
MTKEEYASKLIQLASKCRTFAEETCLQWRTSIPGSEIVDDAVDWEDLGDKDLYLTLETLESKSSLVLHRAKSLLEYPE